MQFSLLMGMAGGAAGQAHLTQLSATAFALPGCPLPCPGPRSTVSPQCSALHTSHLMPLARGACVHCIPTRGGTETSSRKKCAERGMWAAEHHQRFERASVLLWKILSLLHPLATHMKNWDNSCLHCLLGTSKDKDSWKHAFLLIFSYFDSQSPGFVLFSGKLKGQVSQVTPSSLRVSPGCPWTLPPAARHTTPNQNLCITEAIGAILPFIQYLKPL